MAVTNGVNKDTVAVIAGALAAMGIGFSRIKAIRPAARPARHQSPSKSASPC